MRDSTASGVDLNIQRFIYIPFNTFYLRVMLLDI